MQPSSPAACCWRRSSSRWRRSSCLLSLPGLTLCWPLPEVSGSASMLVRSKGSPSSCSSAAELSACRISAAWCLAFESTSRGRKDRSLAEAKPHLKQASRKRKPHLEQASPRAVWRAPKQTGPTQPAAVEADCHPAVPELCAEMGPGHPAQPLTAAAGWVPGPSALQACSNLSSTGSICPATHLL